MARENGSVDWWTPFGTGIIEDTEFPEFAELMGSVDVIIMGRKAYEGCLRVSVESNESIGDWLSKRNMKCYIFTNGEFENYQNVEFVSDVVGFVECLKDQKNKANIGQGCEKGILLGGGGEINRLMLENGLIDELFLMIAPVVLGKGLSLFNAISNDVTWRIGEVKQYPKFIMVKYHKLIGSE